MPCIPLCDFCRATSCGPCAAMNCMSILLRNAQRGSALSYHPPRSIHVRRSSIGGSHLLLFGWHIEIINKNYCSKTRWDHIHPFDVSQASRRWYPESDLHCLGWKEMKIGMYTFEGSTSVSSFSLPHFYQYLFHRSIEHAFDSAKKLHEKFIPYSINCIDHNISERCHTIRHTPSTALNPRFPFSFWGSIL